MFATALRASLFAVAALTVSVGSSQPPDGNKKQSPIPGVKPSYTAFPDLKGAPPNPKAEFLSPVLPTLPANATLLRQVQREQAIMGFLYLARMDEQIRIGRWIPDHFDHYLFMASAVYTVAADLEDKPADRVPWYEERVRLLKGFERFTEIRAEIGTEWPYRLLQARFARLGAEADLLRLKAEVAKAGGATGRPLVMKKIEFDFPRPNKGKIPLLAPATVFTAFPDLTPRQKVVTDPDGTIRIVEDEQGYVPLPRLPLLPANPTELQKLHHEQVRERFAYLQNATVVVPLSLRTPDFRYPPFWIALGDTYRAAAELEPRLPARIPWYESRVRDLKTVENYIIRRVEVGTSATQDLDALRYLRLQSEADLIRLKREVEKGNPATAPEPIREKSPFVLRFGSGGEEPGPTYTAFPDLKPRTVEHIEVKNENGKTQRISRDKDVVPLPALPAVGADAPLMRKVLFEQLQVGLGYLDMQRASILRGTWTPDRFVGYVRMATEVYRIAFELEDSREKRVPWYEARVRTLKDIERFVGTHVPSGSDPPQNLNTVRVARLQAEAELLILKTELEPTAVAPPVYVLPCCPPACVQPRQRLLPRLFRR